MVQKFILLLANKISTFTLKIGHEHVFCLPPVIQKGSLTLRRPVAS